MTEGHDGVPRETRRGGDRPSAEKVREAVSEAVSTVAAGVLGAGEVIYGGGGMTPIAEEVKESGESQKLRPMTPFERKIVHDAVASVDGVHSESEGEEPRRRVVVLPGR